MKEQLLKEIEKIEKTTLEYFNKMKGEISYKCDDFVSIEDEIKNIENQLKLMTESLDNQAHTSEKAANDAYNKISKVYYKFKELDKIYIDFNSLNKLIQLAHDLSSIDNETWKNLESLISIFGKK